MEPVLTQEELEAIYAAMKGDDLPSVSVDDVALTAGQEFITRAENKWNEVLKRICTDFQSVLMGSLGRRATVRMYPSEAWVEETGEGGDADVIPIKDASSVLATARIGELKAIFAIDLELARKVVERRTGAVTEEEEGETVAKLTPLEFRLLADLIQELVKVVARASTQKGESHVSHLDPEDVWASRNTKDIWIIGSVGIAEMNGRGFRFIAPSETFMTKAKNSRDAIAKHLQRATVTLSVELGKFRLNVAKLWHLKAGTVIPLHTTVGDPLHIAIGGVAKLRGEPMVSRGNVAVRLIDRIENGVN